MSVKVEALSDDPPVCAALAELLIETVAGGGSVSFMHPLAMAPAEAFWAAALASAGRGERVVLGAFAGEDLVGTVSLLLDLPPNQPHRAEIAKLMTRKAYRGQGVGTALMRAAEALAIERERSLLVLDTAGEEGAAPFYERLGYTRAGEIPDFALKPHGGLTSTILFWKRLPVRAKAGRESRNP
ncbi:GNAT family N-acetyltransferase [Consotaella aegiceratis]|uniref:GNAT family N-acetyltransferase n=1 Tax=Consotaella aegiceratis TaxID=3097961 RepID=UPI002F412390